jgi:hypothetical protein
VVLAHQGCCEETGENIAVLLWDGREWHGVNWLLVMVEG